MTLADCFSHHIDRLSLIALLGSQTMASQQKQCGTIWAISKGNALAVVT